MTIATFDITLLDIAAESIRHGLEHGQPAQPQDYPAALDRHGACFVTLHSSGKLRGCIGSARAWRPLATDVAVNAFGAAFEDPRFDPVDNDALDALDIDISLLGPATPIAVASEVELAATLRPGRDGAILIDGHRRGLFLPAVWESVPDPAEFVSHLMDKAGIERWSPRVRAERFETRSVTRPARGR